MGSLRPPTRTGVRIAGDMYQWLHAWEACVVALSDRMVGETNPVIGVGAEINGVGNLDDVIRFRQEPPHSYSQIKYAVDARTPVGADYLLEPSSSGGPSILGKIASAWRRLTSGGCQVELALITNRSLDASDPLVSRCDARTMLLMPRAGEGGPNSAPGKARRRWAEAVGLTEAELLELLEVLKFDAGFPVPRLRNAVAAQMRAIGLPDQDKDLEAGANWVARQVRDSHTELDLTTIDQAVAELWPQANLATPQLTTSVIDFSTPAAVEALAPDLRGFLNAQRRAADAFPYVLAEGHAKGMFAVHVVQGLSSVLLEPAPERMPKSSGDAGTPVLVERRVPGKSAEDLLRACRKGPVLLTGEAGQGKSTFTLQLAARLAGQWLEIADADVLPIRVNAVDLISGNDLSSALVGAATIALGLALDRPLAPNLMEATPPGAQWLIIVDGMDEVGDPQQRRALMNQLVRRAVGERDWYLLIAGRPMADLDRLIMSGTGAAWFALESFNEEQISRFVRAWFEDGTRGEVFLKAVREQGLSELTALPLFATIAAIVHQDHPDHVLPDSRYLLLEHYLAHLAMARRQRTEDERRRLRDRVTGASGGAIDDLYRLHDALVQQLAQHSVAGEVTLEEAALTWLSRPENLGPLPQTEIPGWTDIVRIALDSTGLFVRSGNGDLRFVHAALGRVW